MWQKKILDSAADQLAGLGHPADAETLRFAAASIDFAACGDMWMTEGETLAVDIFNAVSNEEIAECLRRLTSIYPIDHASFHLVDDTLSILADTKVITTFEESWVERYISQGSNSIDPIMIESLRRRKSFNWADIEIALPSSQRFMEEAAAAGVGPSGYTFLVNFDGGEKYALSVTSRALAEEFAVAIEPCLVDLGDFASYFASAFRSMFHVKDLSQVMPSKVEMQMLKAFASGKSAAEIEAEGFLDEPLEIVKQRTLQSFGAKSLEHAITLAIASGKIVVAPLAHGEVFRAKDVVINVHEDPETV